MFTSKVQTLLLSKNLTKIQKSCFSDTLSGYHSVLLMDGDEIYQTCMLLNNDTCKYNLCERIGQE